MKAIAVLLGCLLSSSFLFFCIRIANKVEVGAYYYVWYDEGLGNRHWKRDLGSENVVDKPFLDYYNSCDSVVCRKHIHWFEQLGLDFAVISWWGINSWEDRATSVVFNITAQYAETVKLAIMVEPFNETGSGYRYQEIYDYIYDNYVSKYPSVYYRYHDKPLLCFYNDPYLTLDGNVPGDDGFTSIIVGHQNYVDWIYWGTPNKIVNKTINVMPRYDDSRVRSPNQTIDPRYQEGVYDTQWLKALNYACEGKVDIIMITSFNEFHERTQVEPCFDNTSYTTNPFLIFDKTRKYIQMLRDRCDRVGRALHFVESQLTNYHGDKWLCKEHPRSKRFWIYNDNYLAYQILNYYGRNDSVEKIKRTIKSYNLPLKGNNRTEVLFNRNITFPPPAFTKTSRHRQLIRRWFHCSK